MTFYDGSRASLDNEESSAVIIVGQVNSIQHEAKTFSVQSVHYLRYI
ncbi:hypothetical protein T03_4476 [Trichinella britovi]|uniref:Uncharacterized protein n=1 Tax=Trichinella britovi TaxID=45882 RepID=A0A0V0YT22_TRIBR|nr:hypothetical protein T03_4476 [Trichinella britovi]